MSKAHSDAGAPPEPDEATAEDPPWSALFRTLEMGEEEFGKPFDKVLAKERADIRKLHRHWIRPQLQHWAGPDPAKPLREIRRTEQRQRDLARWTNFRVRLSCWRVRLEIIGLAIVRYAIWIILIGLLLAIAAFFWSRPDLVSALVRVLLEAIPPLELPSWLTSPGGQ